METVADNKVLNAPDRHNRLSGVLSRWLMFFAGVFLIWTFMYVIAPWFGYISAVRTLTDFIEARGIDASALYYTEVEETSEAEMYLHDSLTYAPVSNDQ